VTHVAGGLRTVDLVASGGLLFTAQSEVPAFVLAGVSGWAVNDWINSPLASFSPVRQHENANSLRPMQSGAHSEFTEHFAAVDAAQVSPEIDIDVL